MRALAIAFGSDPGGTDTLGQAPHSHVTVDQQDPPVIHAAAFAIFNRVQVLLAPGPTLDMATDFPPTSANSCSIEATTR